jgi:hypothetical protein
VFYRNFGKLGHENGDCLGTMVFMPLDGNRFDFQRINDKVKDKLVLSVVWCWSGI